MAQPKDPAAGAPAWEECVALLERLPHLPPEEQAESVLVLLKSPSPGIRYQTIRMAAALLPEGRAIAFLRDGAHDVLRNAGMEILKRKGKAAFQPACELLADEDPDVVLSGVLILESLRDPRSLEPLRRALAHPNPNVVQAGLAAIGKIGDARGVHDLLPFLKGDPWFQVAAIQALGDLRCRSAVRPLGRLLEDPMTGPIAAEALANIGGPTAFGLLASYWLRFSDELEPESVLGLLAHVAQGLPARPRVVHGLRSSVLPVLKDASDHNRLAAAHCLLSLGPGEGEEQALEVLWVLSANSADLPGCLNRRRDLVPGLLRSGGLRSVWGIRLAARHPRSVQIPDLAAALDVPEASEAVGYVAELFEHLRGIPASGLLLKFYLSLPFPDRNALGDALVAHARTLRKVLAAEPGVDAAAAAVLSALLGAPVESSAAALKVMDPQDRYHALSQLSKMGALMERLPWAQWLAEDPDRALRAACDAAVQSGATNLLPLLREALQVRPLLEIVRAVGEMGDRTSVPLLVSHLESVDPLTRVTILESLGQIGGPEARAALQEIAKDCPQQDVRAVYRALARTALEEDLPLFRKAAAHADWVVRLASAEVLGRFPEAESVSVLTTLASDPVSVVAHRARVLLEA